MIMWSKWAVYPVVSLPSSSRNLRMPCVAIRNCKSATGTKVVLRVDGDRYVGIAVDLHQSKAHHFRAAARHTAGYCRR